jgi:hypothetical protein
MLRQLTCCCSLLNGRQKLSELQLYYGGSTAYKISGTLRQICLNK